MKHRPWSTQDRCKCAVSHRGAHMCCIRPWSTQDGAHLHTSTCRMEQPLKPTTYSNIAYNIKLLYNIQHTPHGRHHGVDSKACRVLSHAYTHTRTPDYTTPHTPHTTHTTHHSPAAAKWSTLQPRRVSSRACISAPCATIFAKTLCAPSCG